MGCLDTSDDGCLFSSYIWLSVVKMARLWLLGYVLGDLRNKLKVQLTEQETNEVGRSGNH